MKGTHLCTLNVKATYRYGDRGSYYVYVMAESGNLHISPFFRNGTVPVEAAYTLIDNIVTEHMRAMNFDGVVRDNETGIWNSVKLFTLNGGIRSIEYLIEFVYEQGQVHNNQTSGTER